MRREARIQAAEGELGSHSQEVRRPRGRHSVPPEWVTDVEVPYKENRAGELGKEVLDLGGSEGCAGREVKRAHCVASAKAHAHGNRMEGRAKGYESAVDRVMKQDTRPTTATGAANLRNEGPVSPWAWCKTVTQYQFLETDTEGSVVLQEE